MQKRLNNRFKGPTRKEIVVSSILGAIISCAFVFGYEISILRELFVGPLSAFILVLLAVVFTLGFYMLNRCISPDLATGSLCYFPVKASHFKLCAIAGAIIFLCWIPIFLAGYPGYFNYDSGTGFLMQWGQFDSGKLNAHHPVFHTLFLGLTLKVGMALFHSFNAGVACYVLLQALIIAGIFAFTIKWLLDRGMGKVGYSISLAYFALDPIVGLFAFSTTKDVLSAAFILVYCLLLSSILLDKSLHHENRFYVALFLVGFAICALRTNVLIGVILVVPLVTIIIYRVSRKRAKAYLVVSLFSVALTLIWLGPISGIMGVEKSPVGAWNSLCIFEQQIARCTLDPSVSADDAALIDDKLPALSYRENLSDIANDVFINHRQCSAKELLDLYLYLGTRYPDVYIEAFLYQTEDAWSPFATIDCYKGGDATDVFQMTEQAPAERHSKLPGLYDFLFWISEEKGIESIPILGCLVSIPFYICMLLVCFARSVLTKNRAAFVFLVPLMVFTLTNLFGPCMLIRYFLYLFFALPAMVFFSFKGSGTSLGRQNINNG